MGHYTTIHGQTVKFRGILMRVWRHICHGIVCLGREQELLNQEAERWSRTPPCCPSCLRILPVGSHFCLECGASLSAQAERHTDRISSAELNRRIGHKKTITGMIQEQRPREKGMNMLAWYNQVSRTRKVVDE